MTPRPLFVWTFKESLACQAAFQHPVDAGMMRRMVAWQIRDKEARHEDRAYQGIDCQEQARIRED